MNYQSIVDSYFELPVEDLLIGPVDEMGNRALRVTVDGLTYDLLVPVDAEDPVDEIEEVEFSCWPPTSSLVGYYLV